METYNASCKQKSSMLPSSSWCSRLPQTQCASGAPGARGPPGPTTATLAFLSGAVLDAGADDVVLTFGAGTVPADVTVPTPLSFAETQQLVPATSSSGLFTVGCLASEATAEDGPTLLVNFQVYANGVAQPNLIVSVVIPAGTAQGDLLTATKRINQGFPAGTALAFGASGSGVAASNFYAFGTILLFGA